MSLLKTIAAPWTGGRGDQQKELDSPAAAVKESPRRTANLWPFRRARPLLGLDIGSHSIKAVVLARRRGEIHLKEAALAETPRRALTEGVLTDALMLSERLRSLRAMFHLHTNTAAVAVSGEKVYCQVDSVRDQEGEGLETLIESVAQTVVPYPLSSAAFDYLELSRDQDSSRRTVLWVSSAPEQVDWLRQAATLAGMTPAVVDVEACALTNAFSYNYQPEPDEVSLLLHVGAREATIALARGGTLLYSRGVVVAQQGYYESPQLAVRLARQIDRHWDELADQASPGIIERVHVSGGPARDPRLAATVGQQTGLTASVLDPFHRIHYTGSTEAGHIAASHSPAMTIAVGLALRSFDDL